MLPGDVYYYSSNSLVLCVQQNLEKEEEPDPQVRLGVGLRPEIAPTPTKSQVKGLLIVIFSYYWDTELLFEKFIVYWYNDLNFWIVIL